LHRKAPNAGRSPAGTRTANFTTLDRLVLRVPVRCSAFVRPPLLLRKPICLFG
jgi:hypothetical protein